MKELDYSNPDDWEVVNDDGLVYRRPKRLHSTTVPPPPPPPDPALVRKNQREWKKKGLLKLKHMYETEIRLWELLSNNNSIQPVEDSLPTTSFDVSGFDKSAESSSARKSLVDELLAQFEAQEGVIRNISNLLDVAEPLINEHEQRFNNQFLDLPVWEPSPNELMKALCDP